MNAKETVKSYMDGIVADLFAAEQAYALLKQIGQNANAINQANFGALFGPLQSVLSNACFLSVAKLFEKPSKNYPTRSIRVAEGFVAIPWNGLCRHRKTQGLDQTKAG